MTSRLLTHPSSIAVGSIQIERLPLLEAPPPVVHSDVPAACSVQLSAAGPMSRRGILDASGCLQKCLRPEIQPKATTASRCLACPYPPPHFPVRIDINLVPKILCESRKPILRTILVGRFSSQYDRSPTLCAWWDVRQRDCRGLFISSSDTTYGFPSAGAGRERPPQRAGLLATTRQVINRSRYETPEGFQHVQSVISRVIMSRPGSRRRRRHGSDIQTATSPNQSETSRLARRVAGPDPGNHNLYQKQKFGLVPRVGSTSTKPVESNCLRQPLDGEETTSID
ncbi:hypothetical protein QBC47DRAFT_358307 [Echria macrotheca]|uniref:Uncharacterized protein n=1 Tax=Echria macrotheca TaxID=438768 RepID=A0AAJ0FCL1_9PEZI|nr:hypothetical protein QBC47DRAFT_358307 [Echria macrotheca]